MWSDSKIVLQWPHADDKKPVVIANGVSEILELTTVNGWYQVPSDKTADTSKRGIAAKVLHENYWVRSPGFLKTSFWPVKPCVDVVIKIRINESVSDAKNFHSEVRTVFIFLNNPKFCNLLEDCPNRYPTF